MGIIKFANQQMCMILKQKSEQLVGSHINSLIPNIIVDNYHFLWTNFYKTGEAKFIERS